MNTMKTILLTLGLLVAFCLTSCDGCRENGIFESSCDCECAVRTEDNSSSAIINLIEVEGSCDDITQSDLPPAWQHIEDLQGTISCREGRNANGENYKPYSD